MKSHYKFKRLALYGLSFALACVVAGCLSRPALVRQSFALQNPPVTGVAAPKGNGVLAIRNVEVSPLFESRSFVYRTGTDSYEHDPYAGFLVSPGNALTIPIHAFLVNSGAFRDVIESGSLLQPDQVLEVHVSELYGDFRTPGEPAAVLSMRCVLFQTGNAMPPRVMMDKTYSRRIPLPQNTAAALAAGWDKALAEIMTEVTSALAAETK